MKTVISASRRTDLVAFFPDWLAAAVANGSVEVRGPRGRTRVVDLRPESVHTIVLWSKDFSNLIGNRHGLRKALERYGQRTALFTITGLGGTRIEPGVPSPAAALAQLPGIVAVAGDPRRVSIRFDPIFTWREGSLVRSNLAFFETVAEKAADQGIRDIRFSFAQGYRRAVRRTRAKGIDFVDPEPEQKIESASRLAEIAREHGLRLFTCCQPFLAGPAILRSACIDGRLLTALHPRGERASMTKDQSQRPDCGCTRSVDIGSYEQTCPHGCVYCYAGGRDTASSISGT
jgi:hypothetical protein